MDAIQENTHMTAEHTEKGSYEYITLSISIFAFFIALASLYYAVKTYRSQKQTEKNTSLWNMRDERRVLQKLCIHAIDSLAKLLTIERFVVTKSQYPAETLFHDMLFDVSSLHTSMYIADSDDRNTLYELADWVNNLNQSLNSTIMYFVNHHDFINSDKDGLFNPYIGFNNQTLDFTNYSYFNNEKNCLYRIIVLTNALYMKLWNKREEKERKLSLQLNKNKPFVNPSMKITDESFSGLSLPQIIYLYESVRHDAIEEYEKKDPSSTPFPTNSNIILKCIGADVYVNNIYDSDLTIADGIMEMYSSADGGTLYLKAISINEFKDLISSSKEQKVLRPLDENYGHLLFGFHKNLLDHVCSKISNAFYNIFVENGDEQLKDESINDLNQCLKFRETKRIVYSIRVQGFLYEATFEVEDEILNEMRTNIYSHVSNGKNIQIVPVAEIPKGSLIIDPDFKRIRGMQIMDFLQIDISSLFCNLISINKYAV